MIIPWVKVVLAALQLAEIITTWLRNKELLEAGADREIARASASILAKTKARDEIWKEVSGLGDPEADKAMKDLEPK